MAKPSFTPASEVETGKPVQAVHVTNLEEAVQAILAFLPEDFVEGVEWADVTGKPSTFAPTIGETATTAASGNHNHAIVENATAGLAAAPDLQTAFELISARVKTLEDAPE